MNRCFQVLKWTWLILFFGMGFAGMDFCNICPIKAFNSAQGGYWISLSFGGFTAVALLIGSFFINRFWCLMCPVGYLIGLFSKFNIIKLKKNCKSCTECGACYHACPMRIKNIYMERENPAIQTTDCLMCGECILKCPENKALCFTCCGKTIYSSSRRSFMVNSKKSGKPVIERGNLNGTKQTT